jgi:hypothetical protein
MTNRQPLRYHSTITGTQFAGRENTNCTYSAGRSEPANTLATLENEGWHGNYMHLTLREI